MMNRVFASRWGYGLLGVLAVGCGCSRTDGVGEAALRVAVSIPPQAYFLERIAGDRVAVVVMVGPGESPATYEPKPSQLRVLSEAAVYFRIGVPFEDAWMDRLAPMMEAGEMVHVAEEQADLAIRVRHGDHDHGHGTDPHTWLSPRLAADQAGIMCDTLCRLDPGSAEVYRGNLAALRTEIEALDDELKELLAGCAGGRFMVFHPSWGYFARDYALEQVPIEVGGQEPSARELAALLRLAEEEGIRVVFVQPEFDTSKAETIAASLSGEIIRVSPLAEDWAANLRRMGRSLAEVLHP